MDIPLVAIDWLVRHAESNLELAQLSNINQAWRQQVARSVVRQVSQNEEPSASSFLLLPSMVRAIVTKEARKNGNQAENGDTFCAAWFPPEGIMSVLTPSSPLDFSDEEEEGFSPGGAPSYEGSGDERRRRIQPGLLYQSKSSNSNDASDFRPCCPEWRGLREATDLLERFGYFRGFVEHVINMARDQSGQNTQQTNDVDQTILARQTTFAVRGATFARPEGYCLCMERSAEADSPPRDRGIGPTKDRSQSPVLWRRQRHRLMQRQMLPRVVMSSQQKNQFLPLEMETTTARDQEQQQCIQFLNASGYNAVRLLTPPFECGTIHGSVTIACVGIATEDGCFMSGLKLRCELGHMYPSNKRDVLVDMSPVCVTMEKRKIRGKFLQSQSILSSRSASSEFSEEVEDDDDSSYGSARCSSNNDPRPDMRCSCPFATETRVHLRDSDTNSVPEDCIHRGTRGPGFWHCYVAVIGNGESIIRIDGQPENVRSTPPREGEMHVTMLDGLTIGSDHTFDMSLCFGQGSEEEGEGAIAELAVFKGRLPLADIEQLEGYLMKRHGIRRANPGSELFFAEEEEGRRQARALIAQPPPYTLTGKGVPLRIVARDPAVAWQRVNAVTGEQVMVGRIGSKQSTGSSDW